MRITTELALALWSLGVGMTDTSAETASEGQIWVELVDTTGLPRAAIEALESEVDSIYERGGVRIVWRKWVEPAPHAARVYLLEALPLSLDRRLQVRGIASMGLALGRSGEVSGPTIYIGRALVTSTLTEGAVSEPVPERLGRALGRVVAHELAHRFIQRRHGRDGILKAELGPAELQGSVDPFYFTEAQRSRLKTVARSSLRPGDARVAGMKAP